MTLVLAQVNQEEAIRALRQGFVQHGANLDFQLVLWIAAALLGLAFVLSRLVRRSPTVTVPEPVEYFVGLARRLRIPYRDVDLLRTLAVASRLPHPACLLLSPGNLAQGIAAARRFNEQVPYIELDQLCRRIFGTPLP